MPWPRLSAMCSTRSVVRNGKRASGRSAKRTGLRPQIARTIMEPARIVASAIASAAAVWIQLTCGSHGTETKRRTSKIRTS